MSTLGTALTAFGGTVLGFILSAGQQYRQNRQQVQEFFKGLKSDLDRCQKLDLSLDDTLGLQLMNPLNLPYVERVARGDYVANLTREELLPLLQIQYLMANYRRFLDPEMAMIVDNIREKVSLRGDQRLEHLRNQALAPLESSLSTYVTFARQQLAEHHRPGFEH